MLYLDTSLLVAAYTHETGTERALAFLENRERERLAISGWVVSEFSAALSMKIRTGEIDEAYRAEASALFAQAAAESLEMISVTTTHFKAAAKFVEQHELGLRAADALHLAVAGDAGATICTLDKRLANAGKSLGVATTLLW